MSVSCEGLASISKRLSRLTDCIMPQLRLSRATLKVLYAKNRYLAGKTFVKTSSQLRLSSIRQDGDEAVCTIAITSRHPRKSVLTPTGRGQWCPITPGRDAVDPFRAKTAFPQFSGGSRPFRALQRSHACDRCRKLRWLRAARLRHCGSSSQTGCDPGG